MATSNDALVVMEVMRWRRDTGVDDALERIFHEGFERERAAVNDPSVRCVLTFVELVGGFVRYGALDRELALHVWPIQGAWRRLGPAVLRFREQINEPLVYENFEWLATSED